MTKTLEYSYDDYAVALLADALGDKENHDMLMKRTSNYKNLFDPSTGLMRGRLENGEGIMRGAGLGRPGPHPELGGAHRLD